MRIIKLSSAPAVEKISLRIENDDGIRTAIEDVDPVV
jgi:hypothetical protein